MYTFLWMFFIYAFLGWCMEVSYAALNTGKFVNRGFLNGPLCPIYGLGAVLVLRLLEPFNDSLPLLFAGSVLVTSALEWLTGFVLEKLFHQRWWDYTDQPFNLGGYICLKFSIAWGFACLFVVKLLHPSVELFIRILPHALGVGLLWLLAAYGVIDLTATVRTILGINARLAQIDEMAERIRAHSDEFGESLSEKVLDAAARGADWKEDADELLDKLEQRRDEAHLQTELARMELRDQLQNWKEELDGLLNQSPLGQRRLLRAFPKLRSLDHAAALERLRLRYEKQGTQKKR